MDFLFDDRPIIALSSSTSSNSAIGVIRLSGFNLISDYQKVFSRSLAKILPRTSYLSNIIDPRSGSLIDEVTFIYYQGPSSYNGENILEIFCHGNQIVIQNIIELFLGNFDIRLAGAGEFTYRALASSKLSLTQVEGLDLLLNANSPHVINSAQSSFKGQLHNSYLHLHSLLDKLKGSVDLSLDFAEDIGDDVAKSNLLNSFTDFKDAVETLYQRTLNNTSALLNPSIVLFGSPNAGKSTLFNYLLSQERSIVSDVKGTTRDYVTESITIDKVLYVLTDTAGLRETDDIIEKEGIKLTHKQIDDAFFSILLIDSSELTESFNPDIYDAVVVSHCDQIDPTTALDKSFHNIYYTNLCGPMGPELVGPMGPHIKNGPIGPNLKTLLFSSISDKYNDSFTKEPILIDRQRIVISNLFQYLATYGNEICTCEDYGVLSFHINKISLLAEELIGIITPDEVLTSIFTNFCIGK